MKSFESKEKLKEKMSDLLNDIDSIYNNLHSEVHEELYGKMRSNIEIEQSIEDLYFNHLNEEIGLKLIKSKLPLRVKLFNKINYLGMGISRTGRNIDIYFGFNNNAYGKSFQCSFTSSEIRKIIK